MGLLDDLGFGSSGGGLLDFLRNNAMNQQFTSGLPSDQAQYGSYTPPMQPMQQPLPQPPQPPQPPSPVMPQQPMAAPQPVQQPVQQQQPGLGLTDRLGAGFRGMMANAPAGPLGLIMGGVAGLAGMGQGSPANQTAQALLAKGVDPVTVKAAIANPELMKTLITQTYGPQNVQALGNGYIRDPRTGKITRAYTPDDKIPSGFTQDDQGNLHFMPGGPADPAYLRLKAAQSADPNAVHVLGKGGELYKVDDKGNATVVHKNEDNIQASLDDATTAMMAKQYLAGDRTVLQNLGRGAQGSANIVKLRAAIKAEADAQGLNGSDVAQRMIDYVGDTARERTAGTQEGRMGPAGIEAMGAVKLARQASLAVPRGNWVPINMAIQAWQKNTGDPNIRAFGAANTTLINTYARAINPNGIGTVADKEHAREMLSTADSPAAYEAVISQLEREIQMAHASPSQARGQFKEERTQRLNGIAPTAPVISEPPAAKTPALPKAGDVQGGYRFKGGDPADKKNWVLEQKT